MKLIHTNTNNIKKSLLYIFPIITVATFTLVLTVIYNIHSISNSSAINPSTGTDVFTVSAGTSLGVSVADSTTLDIQPTSGGAFNSTPLTVYVETDNEYGYTLSMTTTTPDLKRTTPLSDGTVPTIETLASGSSFTSDTFTTNRWGYTLDNTNYYAIPGSVIINSAGTSGNYEDNPNVITFAAKLDNATPSGNYLTTINFIATAKTPADLSGFDAAFIFAGADKLTHDGESYYAMQDLTYGVCSYVATPSSSNIDSYPTVTVFDSRDYEKYTIGKLADGNCWLLDNLRLGGDSPIALTPADTNIASNWTLPASGNTCFSADACTGTNGQTGNGYTVPAINIDSSNEQFSYGNGNGIVGTYYNYCAITAGTNCPTDQNSINSPLNDVCPKSWKLPSGNTDAGNYGVLKAQYQTTSNMKQAAHIIFSGYYSTLSGSTTAYNKGNLGLFAEAAHYEGSINFVPSLYFDSGTIDINHMTFRTEGASIRCVSRQTISDLTYMQDFASLTDTDKTDVINSMLPGQAYQLIDNRDNEVYNVAKLADGNVWLLDNLRLDPATLLQQLTPTNTNMDPNIPFELPSSVSEGFGTVDSSQVAMINTESKDIIPNVGYQGKVGVYYNYCAASAGTYCVSDSTGLGNAEYDICPSGWGMPTSTGTGEYQQLYNAYNNYTTFVNAYRFVLNGIYAGSAASAQGENSLALSSSNHDTYTAWSMRNSYSDSAIYPSNLVARGYGAAVRCILK